MVDEGIEEGIEEQMVIGEVVRLFVCAGGKDFRAYTLSSALIFHPVLTFRPTRSLLVE